MADLALGKRMIHRITSRMRFGGALLLCLGFSFAFIASAPGQEAGPVEVPRSGTSIQILILVVAMVCSRRGRSLHCSKAIGSSSTDRAWL